MSFLDSPVCRCELMHTMVLTDQTQRQCAEEHQCSQGQACPLGDCFAATAIGETPAKPQDSGG